MTPAETIALGTLTLAALVIFLWFAVAWTHY
jgi:hypothetical protein